MAMSTWLDVQCIARLDTVLPNGRCQLYAGHSDAHAMLLASAAGRLLRRWADTAVTFDVPFGPVVPAQLPWAPTFPQPQP